MKLLLLAASLVLLGGCVAPGYYVQPDYSGGGGYYSGGYYGSDGYYGSGGYYPDYYGGCCASSGVSIGYGYDYGYPGYYGWSGYPYRYGGYYGHDGHYRRHGDHDRDGHRHGDHDRNGHHWDKHDHDGDHQDSHWHGDHMDGAVQRWPSAQRWRNTDRAPIPHWNEVTRSGGLPVPQPQMISPRSITHVAPQMAPRSPSGAAGRAIAPVRSWSPRRSATAAPKKF